ncbi:MAG TPA: DUF3187 family protein [Gammaproteobacteria bacterium]
MGGRFRAIVAVLALACLCSPALAEAFYGPLRIRDMGPFQLLRLNMLPDHAIAPAPGRFAIELHLSQSNTFAADEDVLHYLESRDRRDELSAEDVENIRALSEDAFLFDAALGYFQLSAHYGLSDRWSAYLAVPVHYYSGGFLDSTIESFHDAFGFDSFGREFISRNDFQALAILDGDVFYLLERPLRSGIGDPVIGVRYYYPLPRHSALTFELAHKVSVHGGTGFLSTGASDTGVQVSWHAHGERNSIYVSAALVLAGRAEPFPEHTRRFAPSLNIAWEHRLAQNLNLVLQLNGARSLFENGADAELTANVFQASVGLRQRHGEFVWSYALTENLVNFNNTADLGFHVGFAWLPDAPGVY